MNSDTFELVETLEEQLDTLTESLGPLLKSGLQDTATKLTVADKARLYVLITYGIESLLFSYLRLNGTNAQDHPVMRELTRVRQYVSKIKEAQEATPREMQLDKAAAGRFIKASLAGNEKYDQERAEREARERAGAKAKLEELERKVLEGRKQISELQAVEKPAPATREPESEGEDLKIIGETSRAKEKSSKKRKKSAIDNVEEDASAAEKKQRKKEKRKEKKRDKTAKKKEKAS